jgi:uncharacterized membrane protein
MTRFIRAILRNADGAVAPIVALSLTALVAAGGIAFDYARLASMDTELQDAADQAALAAASQLDRQTGACARAAAAASSLLSNNTLFADDGAGTAVVVPTSGVTDCAGNAAIKIPIRQDPTQMMTRTPSSWWSASLRARQSTH